ncbi:MAG: hypothetical protein ACRDTO_00750 [Mycobacterium sp.]
MAAIAALCASSLDGWITAGVYKFASALTTSGAIAVPAYDELMIIVRVVSLSTSDVPALRFNADAGNNYRCRYVVNNALSGTTLTDGPDPSVSVAELSFMSSTLSRVVLAVVNNKLAASKVGTVVSAIGSGSAASQQKIDIAGSIEWANTTAQITSVELRTFGGTATFGIDSGMAVLGKDPPES